MNFVDAKINISKFSEISGFETFISDDFISSRKCPILMVDPALNSLDSELFNALFEVFTAFFPADLSRKIACGPFSPSEVNPENGSKREKALSRRVKGKWASLRV